MSLINLRSPGYSQDAGQWATWRAAADITLDYVRDTLQRLPGEDHKTYEQRKNITPIPAFIKATLREVVTGIYTQMELTTRSGGPASLQKAILGFNAGVDGAGTTMNYFVIMRLLRELLVMKRVGVFIDRAQLSENPTVAESIEAPPYIYMYTAEQILAWHIKPGNLVPTEILLSQEAPIYYPETNLTEKTELEYIYLKQINPEIVSCTIFNSDDDIKNQYELNLPMIPFVLLELDESIIQDAINHQAALLNLGSANISFAISSNLALYTEQSDLATLMLALRTKQDQEAGNDDDADDPGTESGTIKIGQHLGRRYMQKADPPAFISPDNTNLERSSLLYDQLRDDIRRLILLAIQNVSVRGIMTATSLHQSQAATSNGLSALAVLLERAERYIAKIWAAYEVEKDTFSVKYPADFQVLSKAERVELIKSLADLRKLVPSKTYREHITTTIASLVLGTQVSPDELETIKSEILQAPCQFTDPDTIDKLVEAGILPREYAAQTLNLPSDAAEKANAEHAERLRRISEAQSSGTPSQARGNPDGVDDSNFEKVAPQDPESGVKLVRE